MCLQLLALISITYAQIGITLLLQLLLTLLFTDIILFCLLLILYKLTTLLFLGDVHFIPWVLFTTVIGVLMMLWQLASIGPCVGVWGWWIDGLWLCYQLWKVYMKIVSLCLWFSLCCIVLLFHEWWFIDLLLFLLVLLSLRLLQNIVIVVVTFLWQFTLRKCSFWHWSDRFFRVRWWHLRWWLSASVIFWQWALWSIRSLSRIS